MARKRIDRKVESLVVKLCNEDKMSIGAISKHIQISKSTGFEILKRVTNPQPINQGGRPRKTSRRTDGRIVRKSKRNPILTAPEIREDVGLFDISVRTVQRRLVEAGLYGRRPAKKPLLSKKNIKARLAFAQKYRNYTTADWKKLLWSDESKFNLYSDDGKGYVRRSINKRFDSKYTKGTIKFGRGSVMIWDCFSWHGVDPLHRINGKMDPIQYREILESIMLPYATEHMPNNWWFQHDNDPKHTAKIVKTWLQCKKLMFWIGLHNRRTLTSSKIYGKYAVFGILYQNPTCMS